MKKPITTASTTKPQLQPKPPELSQVQLVRLHRRMLEAHAHSIEEMALVTAFSDSHQLAKIARKLRRIAKATA